MDLSNLKPAIGSNKSGKRVGRGQGSGKGGTSTRGHKGAKSRSGYKTKIGFKNINRIEYKAVNLSVIEELATAKGLAKITVEDLKAAGFVGKKELVKILANGTITAKVEVVANAFSKKAEEAIIAAGGSIQKI